MANTTKTYVWIPFGDLMHEDAPGGPNWRKTQMNPEWWAARLDIFERFTLRALANQTNQDFELVAGVAEEAGDMPAPLYDLAKRWPKPIRIIRHPANDPAKKGQTAAPVAILQLLQECDTARIVWNDSDDAYHPLAMAEFIASPDGEGQVCAFRKGYIAQVDWGRAHVYYPRNGWPPFFSRIYTKDACKDADALGEYERKWDYHRTHAWLSSSVRLSGLSESKYCVMIHGQNMSTRWNHDRTQAKIFEQLDEVQVKRLRESFGLL